MSNMPTAAIWVVKRVHKTELEVTLNDWTNSGYELEYLFPPIEDKLFTCVFRLYEEELGPTSFDVLEARKEDDRGGH